MTKLVPPPLIFPLNSPSWEPPFFYYLLINAIEMNFDMNARQDYLEASRIKRFLDFSFSFSFISFIYSKQSFVMNLFISGSHSISVGMHITKVFGNEAKRTKTKHLSSGSLEIQSFRYTYLRDWLLLPLLQY